MFHLSVCATPPDSASSDELKSQLRQIGARLRDERHAVDVSQCMPAIHCECDLRVYSDSGGLPLDDFPFQTLPLKRSPLVLILAIPKDFEVFSFLETIDGIGELAVISRKRFAGESKSTDFDRSVIIRFTEQTFADAFHRGYHLQYFHQAAPVPGSVCYVVFIDRLILQTVDFTDPSSFPETPPFSDQIPACPFCAERLDSDVSNLILSRKGWLSEENYGSACCVACHQLLHPNRICKCDSCGCVSDALWLCLLCGLVGCGRYSKACAQRHFACSGHRFCLEVSSGRIWDYKKEKWVHRRIFVKSEALDLPETFERVNFLGIAPEEDLVTLEEEMQVCLETERQKFESACQQLQAFGESEVGRKQSLLEADSEEVTAIQNELARLETSIKQEREACFRLDKLLRTTSEEIEFLKAITSSQLVTIKSTKQTVHDAKLANSRNEVARLEQEVHDLSERISRI